MSGLNWSLGNDYIHILVIITLVAVPKMMSTGPQPASITTTDFQCDVWPFVFGHERAIAVGSWQYVVRFKLVTKTTLPDKLSL